MPLRWRYGCGMPALTRPRAIATAIALTALLAGGCTGTTATGGSTTGVSSTIGGTTSSASTSTGPAVSASATPTGSGAATPTASTTSAGPTAGGGPAAYSQCVTGTFAALSPDQRVGQLVMVGIQPAQPPAGIDGVLRAEHVGSVIYLGGWEGVSLVRSTSAHLQQTGSYAAGPGRLGMLVAADQEGGSVQQLKGPGFTRLPTATTQGGWTVDRLRETGVALGTELLDAGVNVNLAPVADTVPPSMTRTNQPIGRYQRQFGTDPAVVGRAVPALVDGMQSRGVVATVKHFPGLGRVTGNTDVTAVGITDTTTGPDDPYLEPFQAGMRAGVGMVMVSSARYPTLDPSNQAVFSRPIITGLLRTQLGWTGVVITDDVGAARAVSAVPPGDRAVRFLAAGGDIVLTAVPSQAAAMTAAVQARVARDPEFAASVDESVRRVLALKERFAVLRCG